MSRRTKDLDAPAVEFPFPHLTLTDLPQSIFALVVLHLFEAPLQSAIASIRNLRLVSRSLCQMTSQILGIPTLRVPATTIPTSASAIAASSSAASALAASSNQNPFATVPLEDRNQLCDEVLHGSLEILRVRRMAHELAIREFYLKLPRAVQNWVQLTRAEMADQIAEPLEKKLHLELARLKKIRLSSQSLVKQEGMTRRAPAIAGSIHSLVDQIAHLREHDHQRTDPILQRALTLVRRLRCEYFCAPPDWLQKCLPPTGPIGSEVHSLVRIDLPWEEVLANMATFAENGKRCRVKADLSPVCLQNGRGSVPLFLELEISADPIQLRYALGQAPVADARQPDDAYAVEWAWQKQLGFTKLNKLWAGVTSRDAADPDDDDLEACAGACPKTGTPPPFPVVFSALQALLRRAR
ncbi:hypothetical protein PAPYR_7913 [Paratrimastix pyriformis]|uniref:F-box domain-containing protein n=1 Tax=Paratrimastix pyriformis TaxID=342808 RepID=A0ABQ8UF91_9EUKA|nr:hypothetical protein PAPYR_7913 [Paratrimastix pyriformis]